MTNPLDRPPNPGVAVKPPIQRRPAASKKAAAQWPCVLPSIAVAVEPMRNLTGDPEQQYLVEAFTDDLVTDLLRHGRGLSLGPDRPTSDGRRTSRRGQAMRNFEYIVTGSAQRSGPATLRINMQITDAATGEYCWADRYEFDPDDLAPTQTEITRRISRELHLLAAATGEPSRRDDLQASSSASTNVSPGRRMRSRAEMRPELTAEAQSWFLAALANDPRNVEALIGLAMTCQHLVSQPWWGDPHAVAMASDLGP